MKEGWWTGACPWWEGVGGRGGFAELENEKRKGEYRPISAVGDNICAMIGQSEYPADI